MFIFEKSIKLIVCSNLKFSSPSVIGLLLILTQHLVSIPKNIIYLHWILVGLSNSFTLFHTWLYRSFKVLHILSLQFTPLSYFPCWTHFICSNSCHPCPVVISTFLHHPSGHIQAPDTVFTLITCSYTPCSCKIFILYIKKILQTATS